MYTYRKADRLCSRRQIDLLFSKGRSFAVYPFRAVWMTVPCDGEPALQVLMSVPRRTLKRAVGRNIVRRRMKEAYRLNKGILSDYMSARSKCLRLAILYQGQGEPDFGETERKIILILHRLILLNEEDPG